MELELETKVFNQGSEMHLKLASKEVELNDREKDVGDEGLLALDSTKNVGKKISDIKKFCNERERDDMILWNKGDRCVIATNTLEVLNNDQRLGETLITLKSSNAITHFQD